MLPCFRGAEKNKRNDAARDTCFSNADPWEFCIFWVWPPARMPVTTRTITFLVGNPYKPLFTTVTGRGPHPRYIYLLHEWLIFFYGKCRWKMVLMYHIHELYIYIIALEIWPSFQTQNVLKISWIISWCRICWYLKDPGINICRVSPLICRVHKANEDWCARIHTTNSTHRFNKQAQGWQWMSKLDKWIWLDSEVTYINKCDANALSWCLKSH